MLIKWVGGNGDLESSQSRSGVPGATGTVSEVGRKISFLTEIIAVEEIGGAETLGNARVETKNAGRRSLVVRR